MKDLHLRSGYISYDSKQSKIASSGLMEETRPGVDKIDSPCVPKCLILVRL